jgi:hypothetical protein
MSGAVTFWGSDVHIHAAAPFDRTETSSRLVRIGRSVFGNM